jgi:hypothetical protein
MKSVLSELLSPERLRAKWSGASAPEPPPPPPDDSAQLLGQLRATIDERHPGRSGDGARRMVAELEARLAERGQALTTGAAAPAELAAAIGELLDGLSDTLDALEVGRRSERR